MNEDLELLQEEIREATERVNTRQSLMDGELLVLDKKIITFTKWAWGFVWAGIVVTVLAVIFYLWKSDLKGFTINLLGDFLAGSVASIWSLAGLFFIYVAFLGQKQQLLQQQVEIMYSQLEVKYTRLELAGQKHEMKEQNATLKIQKFENTFFQMLSLFNSIVNSLDLRKRATQAVMAQGRDCFEIFYQRLIAQLKDIHKGSSTPYNIKQSPIDDAIDAFDIFYNNHKSDMSHYFRTLYHIVKFVHESDVDHKKRYIAIVRAQLSSYEQVMLFYNSLHDNGAEKFKPLIEQYRLFKNIDTSLIINQAHLAEYEDSAYGK